MWMRLRKFFSLTENSKSSKPLPTTGTIQAGRPIPAKNNDRDFDCEAIGSAYYSLILGVHSLTDQRLNKFESSVNKQLKKLIKSKKSRSEMVPRLPAVIPKLMGSLRDDNVSMADLARLIGKDATLVSEAIRMANSPYYQTVIKIKDLKQAVTILGRQGVRHVLARAAFKPILNMQRGHFTNLASSWVWRQSEYCAFNANCLAKVLTVDPFSAYLSGLVRDTGIIVALRVMDQIEHIDDVPRSAQFQQLFSAQSLQLSAVIAREWELPDAVAQAIEEQINIQDGEELSALGTLLKTATLMSQTHILTEEQRLDKELKEFICRTENRLNNRCRKCFDKLENYQL